MVIIDLSNSVRSSLDNAIAIGQFAYHLDIYLGMNGLLDTPDFIMNIIVSDENQIDRVDSPK